MRRDVSLRIPIRRHLMKFGKAILLGAVLVVTGTVSAREVDFRERLEAQRAIERVYHAHRIGARLPFDQAVPQEVLERKVRTYLEQSVALEDFWNTPVTAAALERELERILERTRLPDRLAEIVSALGDDPGLLRECLARPVLVGRLTRSFFDYDERIHGAARGEAERLRLELAEGRVDPRAEHPERTVLEIPRGVSSEMRVLPEASARRCAPAPDRLERIGAVVEEREAFVVDVLLEERVDRIRIARYSVPKVRWDDWWRDKRAEFDPWEVRSAQADVEPSPFTESVRVPPAP